MSKAGHCVGVTGGLNCRKLLILCCLAVCQVSVVLMVLWAVVSTHVPRGMRGFRVCRSESEQAGLSATSSVASNAEHENPEQTHEFGAQTKL